MNAINDREALEAMCTPGNDADAAEFARRVDAVVNEALGTQITPDFFQPEHTYTDAEFPEYGWQFRCDTVTTHPDDGERTALGWRHFRGQWEPYAYGEGDWEIGQFVGTTDAATCAEAEEADVVQTYRTPTGDVWRYAGDQPRTGLALYESDDAPIRQTVSQLLDQYGRLIPFGPARDWPEATSTDGEAR